MLSGQGTRAARLSWEEDGWDELTSVTVYSSFLAATGSTMLNQSLAVLSVSLKESVSMTCRANQSISDYLTWYQQKPGQAPKLLIYDADDPYADVPARFTGIQSGTEFILKISEVEADDAATYYCQQDYLVPPTVLQS